jgi:hypothetical protein
VPPGGAATGLELGPGSGGSGRMLAAQPVLTNSAMHDQTARPCVREARTEHRARTIRCPRPRP